MERIFKYWSQKEPNKNDQETEMKILMSQSQIIITRKNKEKVIEMNRLNNQVQIADQKPRSIQDYKIYNADAVFGELSVFDQRILILVSGSSKVAQFHTTPYYQVQEVEFLSVKQNINPHLLEQTEEIIQGIRKYLKFNFYFSYEKQIGFSLQSNTQEIKGNKFIWNLGLFQHFPKGAIMEDFFAYFIQGFIGSLQTDIFSFLLISRRSFQQGGTRYNCRGIDAFGNVANFVETEQIIETKSTICSFLQIRGSLPFFWEQNGIQAKVEIHQSLESNVKSFRANLEELLGKFYKVNFVNLLSRTKKQEKKLAAYLENLLQNFPIEKIEKINYEQIDFHSIVKELDFSNVNPYVEKMIDRNDFSVFLHNFIDDSIDRVQQQHFVTRTNCLDCLDRTNAFQTKVSFYLLDSMLKYLKINLVENYFGEQDIIKLYDQSNNKNIQKIKSIWADNGDQISKIYAGTGATTSSVTRAGEKRNFFAYLDHGVKTISRFYKNNFEDDFKQKIYKILVKNSQGQRKEKSQEEKTKINIKIVHLKDDQSNEKFLINTSQLIDQIEFPQSDFVVLILAKDEGKKIQFLNSGIKESKFLSTMLRNLESLNASYQVIGNPVEQNLQVIFLGKNESQNVDFFKEQIIQNNGKGNFAFYLSVVINNISFAFLISDIRTIKCIEEIYKEIFQQVKQQQTDVVFFIDKNLKEFQLHKFTQEFREIKDYKKTNQMIGVYRQQEQIEELQMELKVIEQSQESIFSNSILSIKSLQKISENSYWFKWISLFSSMSSSCYFFTILLMYFSFLESPMLIILGQPSRSLSKVQQFWQYSATFWASLLHTTHRSAKQSKLHSEQILASLFRFTWVSQSMQRPSQQSHTLPIKLDTVFLHKTRSQ